MMDIRRRKCVRPILFYRKIRMWIGGRPYWFVEVCPRRAWIRDDKYRLSRLYQARNIRCKITILILILQVGYRCHLNFLRKLKKSQDRCPSMSISIDQLVFKFKLYQLRGILLYNLQLLLCRFRLVVESNMLIFSFAPHRNRLKNQSGILHKLNLNTCLSHITHYSVRVFMAYVD